MKILVTGASGFIGRFLCARLLAEGLEVRGTILKVEDSALLAKDVEASLIESIGPSTRWASALVGIDTIIHLAARVHVMDDKSSDPLMEFRKVNVEGTAHLAREAARAGVKRLVFVSSVKVNGEESVSGYTELSPARPTDPYGMSKSEAEGKLREIASETRLEVVVVRPPLVYGPGVKANFLNMMRAVSKRLPLPLASIRNNRSLVYVGNLVDALAACALHPAAAGQTYLVSDGEDVSTPQLIKMTACALGVPAKLFPFPLILMRLAGVITGKSAAISRLTGSLSVDITKIRQELNWSPPSTLEQGLAETGKWFNGSDCRRL